MLRAIAGGARHLLDGRGRSTGSILLPAGGALLLRPFLGLLAPANHRHGHQWCTLLIARRISAIHVCAGLAATGVGPVVSYSSSYQVLSPSVS